MTLPEIQTLLEGVTVGGHKISDQQIALNQGDAWKALFGDVVGDVNKRMGRFMMNGVLLSHGYPVINVPAKRKLGFNELMLDFYSSNKQGPMNQFLRSCIDKRIIKIMLEPARCA